GQETTAERAVGDKADAELRTERQDLGFDIAGPQRILDLHGTERVHGVGPPDRRRAGLAYAEIAHPALVHEITHCPDRVLDRHGRIDTVDVIKVYDIGFEPLQAALAARLDVFRPSSQGR